MRISDCSSDVCSSDLTADAIARAIGCSRASLYRLFEQRGLAVAEHVRAVRLNHSRTLLRDPRLGIGDIALRCGYDDLSAFGKAFRRRFGMTPRDWRQSILCDDVALRSQGPAGLY